MKRITLAFLFAVLVCGIGHSAKTISQLRIYINPGHGSYTSNDRPANTLREVNGAVSIVYPNTAGTSTANYPDTTAFYESNTNLQKGFGMLEELVSAGFSFNRSLGARNLSNNIVMSRVKNGPWPVPSGGSTIYNRGLTEIAAEAQNNNFDLFLSIHSDAAAEHSTTNQALALYRGLDSPSAQTGCTLAYQQASRTCVDIMNGWLLDIKHTNYSSTAKNVRGDWSFYGSHSSNSMGYSGYLGVLKHGVIGGLMEGYCHTYEPARQRAMNWDVDAVEGIAYARGVSQYFGVAYSGKGVIYGIVRHASETFSHTYYTPRSGTADVYKPINNAQVKLKNSAGTIIDTYTTDNYYNGAFVFKGLAPGTYTIMVSKAGFKSVTQSVTVTANGNQYPAISLTPGTDTSGSDPGTTAPTEEPANAASANKTNYPNQTTTIPSNYTMTQDYSKALTKLEGYTVKRMIDHGDYLYFLAHKGVDGVFQPIICVYDKVTQKKIVKTVSLTGCAGNLLAVSDIAVTSDGVLVAINQCTQDKPGSGVATNIKIYKWANNEAGIPTGGPTIWCATYNNGEFATANVGETMCYIGSSTSGKVVYVSEHSTNGNLRLVWLKVKDGAVQVDAANYHYDKFQSLDDGKHENWGDMRLFVSPNGKDRVIFNGNTHEAIEVSIPNTSYNGIKPHIYAQLSTSFVNKKTNHADLFRTGGKVFMTTPTFVSGTTESKNTRLVDVTNGFDSPVTVNSKMPTDQHSTNGECVVGTTTFVKDTNGNVTDAYISVYQIHQITDESGVKKNILTKFDQREPEPVVEPAYYTEYAYDLKAEVVADGTYKLTYSCTNAADAATLVLTPAGSTTAYKRIALGKPVKGVNTTTLSLAGYPATEYSWAIEVQSPSSPSGGLLFTESTNRAPVGACGGIVCITDPTQETFGYTVVGYGKAAGFDVYDPQRVRKVEKSLAQVDKLNSSDATSVFRGDQFQGNAVFADNSLTGSGFWKVNPIDLINTPTNRDIITNILKGTRDTSTGQHTLSGVVLGGGAKTIAFHPTSTTNKAYSFAEYSAASDPKRVWFYDMGSAATIEVAPTTFGAENLSGVSRLLNKTIDIQATDKGLFISQCRAEGNNTTFCPCFVFVDYDGVERLNSSAVSLPAGCNSGLAVNHDYTKLALAGYTGDISIFNITWSGTTPTLTLAGTIPATPLSTVSTLRFDYGNNLYMLSGQIDEETPSTLRVFAIPSTNPVISTPAVNYLQRDARLTLIETVDADDNAEVVYYNLQSQRMNSDNLTPGIYIKIQGSRRDKVVVK